MLNKKKGWFYTNKVITASQISSNPTPNPPTVFQEKNNDEMEKNDFFVDQELNKKENEGNTSLEADPNNQNYGNPLKINVFFAIFLELDIVKDLQLEKLNLFNLITNGSNIDRFQLIKIFNKRDAVKMYVFNEYSASFTVIGGTDTSTTNTLPKKIKFVVPNNQSQDRVEQHLVDLKDFSYQGDTFRYIRSSLKRTIPR